MARLYAFVFFLLCSCILVNAQAPNINYPSPQSYTVGKVITQLGPVNNGGAVLPMVSFLTSTVGPASNITIGPAGDFIFSSGYMVYRATPAGVITALSKDSYYVHSGFSGYWTQPDFISITGIACDAQGNIFVSDGSSEIIRKIPPTGPIVTIAGSGRNGNADGPGTAASLYYPSGLAVDASGNIYVADTFNNLIRKITPAGMVPTVAGNGIAGVTDGTGTAASFSYPNFLTLDKSGNIYVSGGGLRIISAGNVVKTITSNGYPVSIGIAGNFVVDAYKNIYIAGYSLIQRVTPAGDISTFAGTGYTGNNNGPGNVATFNNITSLAIDGAGNIYAADAGNNAIRKLTPAGYTISPAFPNGLSFDNSTGNITGTSTTKSSTATYAVTAYNSSGTNTAYFYLRRRSRRIAVISQQEKSNRNVMFQNYVKIAWRNILCNKGYSSLNVAGLSIGIAACLLIFVIVHYELSYDTYQPDYKNIYHVVTRIHQTDGVTYSSGTADPTSAALRLDFPQAKVAALESNYGGQVIVPAGKGNAAADKKFIENTGMVSIEPQFFDIFK